MTIGPLKFLARMHCNGEPLKDWLIASWHPRASLTWRWTLQWSPYRPYNDSFWYFKKNGGAAAGFRLPIIGNLSFESQEFMLDTRVLPIPEIECR